MKHLRYITCHPSRIGLFHKDHPLVVFFFFILFAALAFGALALKDFNTSYFGSGDIDFVVSTVVRDETNLNIEYKNHTLTGDTALLTNKPLEVRVLASDKKVDNNGLIIYLNENTAKVYYNYIQIGNIKYTDIQNDYAFTFAGVKENNRAHMYNFRGFIDYIFLASNLGYAANTYISDILNMLLFYFIFAIVAVLIYSFFTNSQIAMGVRSKLIIYDSLIYFVIMFFAICLNLVFLQYVAFFVPVVFCRSTFLHIIKVRK